jgi:hypothetical protein
MATVTRKTSKHGVVTKDVDAGTCKTIFFVMRVLTSAADVVPFEESSQLPSHTNVPSSSNKRQRQPDKARYIFVCQSKSCKKINLFTRSRVPVRKSLPNRAEEKTHN